MVSLVVSSVLATVRWCGRGNVCQGANAKTRVIRSSGCVGCGKVGSGGGQLEEVFTKPFAYKFTDNILTYKAMRGT